MEPVKLVLRMNGAGPKEQREAEECRVDGRLFLSLSLLLYCHSEVLFRGDAKTVDSSYALHFDSKVIELRQHLIGPTQPATE